MINIINQKHFIRLLLMGTIYILYIYYIRKSSVLIKLKNNYRLEINVFNIMFHSSVFSFLTITVLL